MRGKAVIIVLLAAALGGSALLAYRFLADDEPLSLLDTAQTGGAYSAVAEFSTAPELTLSEALARRRNDLERDPNAPVVGNPDGDVTIVEFFDYNCPYCKRIAGDIAQLIADDQGVRVVFREWPILSQESQFAARAALAARRQGKYEELHKALMAQGRVTMRSTLLAAQEIGLDMARLQADMAHPRVTRHIDLSMDLARSLGVIGTPTLIIGDRISRGAVPLDEIRAGVAHVRAANAQAQGTRPRP